MITRRLTLAAPLALAACGTGSTVDPTQAIADANTVVNGVAGVYQQFVLSYPNAVKSDQQDRITAALAAARTALDQLSASASGLTNATNLAAVEKDVNAVLAVLAEIPGLPPQITTAVAMANVLLPLIEAMVGQLQGQAPKVATARPGMSADAARLVLKANAR